MNKNPYTELYELIKGATKTEASFFIAQVINPLPNLEVSFGGIELDKNNLMISNSLLINNGLNIGDMILIYKMNDSTFVVLDKVVSISE
jgi:hypothetical protein